MLYKQDRAGIVGFVQIATVILGLLQFVGSTLILIYGVEESPTLVGDLRDVFLDLVYEYDNDKYKRALLQQIMEYVSETTIYRITRYFSCESVNNSRLAVAVPMASRTSSTTGSRCPSSAGI